LNAAIRKNFKNRATSKRPHKASLFAFANSNEPRISTRLFRTKYSDAEWNVRVEQDGRIKSGVNPKDPRHKNNFNKDTVDENRGVWYARAVMTWLLAEPRNRMVEEVKVKEKETEETEVEAVDETEIFART
jgi:hypothetical protein